MVSQSNSKTVKTNLIREKLRRWRARNRNNIRLGTTSLHLEAVSRVEEDWEHRTADLQPKRTEGLINCVNFFESLYFLRDSQVDNRGLFCEINKHTRSNSRKSEQGRRS